MCGILASNDKSEKFIYAHSMLRHRGPDNQVVGSWGDAQYGFSRLAIRGLGSNGVQPFSCACRRWSIIYNGEISNWKELRNSFNGDVMGNCDGEVIPHMICRFGIESLRNLSGMYAIIAFDRSANSFYALRDPFGIKPLYLAVDEKNWYLSSEIRPLLHLKNFDISIESTTHFKTFGFLSPSQSGFNGISLLPPGRILSIPSLEVKIFEEHYPVKKDFGIMRKQLRKQLGEIVALNSESDVRIGLSYSSGFDSNLIAILLADSGIKNDHLHIAGLTEYSETEQVTRICKRHNFSLNITSIRPQELDLEDYFSKMDRLTFDGLNSYLLSKTISEIGYKSFLTGHGGDEFLRGYPDARIVAALSNEFIKIAPSGLRRNIFRKFRMENRSSLYGKHTYSAITTFPRFYSQSRSIGIEPSIVAYDQVKALSVLESDQLVGKMSNQDMGQISHYMAGLSLLDLDQFSMAFSVEARPPLVDLQILTLLISNGIRTKKQLARELGIDTLLNISSAPKIGFSLNIKQIIEANLDFIQNKLFSSVSLDLLQVTEFQIRKEFNARMNFQNGSSNKLWQYLTYVFWLENASK